MENTALNTFQQREIKGLKRLRNWVTGLFIAVPVGLLGYFTYLVYMNYIERGIHDKSFFEFGLPLSGISVLLLLVFLPVILFINYRVNRFIRLLHEIDKEHLLLYQQYTEAVPRLFASIPPYLFSEKGVLIPKLFSIKCVPYSVIMEISYKKFRSGRNYGTTITLETYDGEKHYISFFLDQKLQFFLSTIAWMHLHIPVIQKKDKCI